MPPRYGTTHMAPSGQVASTTVPEPCVWRAVQWSSVYVATAGDECHQRTVLAVLKQVVLKALGVVAQSTGSLMRLNGHCLPGGQATLWPCWQKWPLAVPPV